MKISLKDAVKVAFNYNGQELSEVNFRQAAARGALKAEKIGKTWYTTEEALYSYLDNRPDHFQAPYRRVAVKNGIRGTWWQSNE